MLHVHQIELREIRLPLREPFRISSGVVSDRRICLLELRDGDGHVAWSECVADELPNYSPETIDTAWMAIREWLAPRVLGREFDGPEDVFDVLDADIRGHRMAKAAIEMGMWALEAERRREPLSRVLGGVRERIEVGVSLGIQETPGALVEWAKQALEQGYRKIKIKIGPGADVDYIAAVREALGPAAPLMADANSAYTLADAEHLARLDAFGLIMLEQPLDHEDLVQHAELQRRLKTPVCLDESITSLQRAEDMLALGSGRIVNIKPGRVGGFVVSKRIHDHCERHGVPVWCGGMLESGIGRAHNVALASLPNFRLPGDTSPSARYWAQDVVRPEWSMAEPGILLVPWHRPGLGVDVDVDRIENLTVRSETLGSSHRRPRSILAPGRRGAAPMDPPSTLEALATPAAVVDLDRMAANLDRMAAYARSHRLQLRPHVKTHKIAELAAEQIQRGAVGLTVATAREAEVMSSTTGDLLVAYPPVSPHHLGRVLDLPLEIRLSVALDSLEALQSLADGAVRTGREVGVLVELDLGMRRCGVPDAASAVALARAASDLAGLEFQGLMFYPGHVREPVDEQGPALAEIGGKLAGFLEELTAAQLEPRVVSGGSTPTATASHRIPGLTEIRPGTYIFNDRTTAAIGACDWDHCAYTVLATVVSTATGQAVVDAGSKALSSDQLRGPASAGYGVLLENREVTVGALSEEHGVLDLSRTGWRPRVGDRVRIIPNHVCVSVNLHDRLWGVRGDDIELYWNVTARGREAISGLRRSAARL